jgi:hypothetical protein
LFSYFQNYYFFVHFKNKKKKMLQGYLVKQGSGITTFGRKTWRRRWFVVSENGFLEYYKDRQQYESKCAPLGKLVLTRGDTVELFECSETKKPCVFKLSTTARELLLCAESEQDRQVWMDVLRNHIRTFGHLNT